MPDLKSIIADHKFGESLTVHGWVRTFRNGRFIALTDGSTTSSIQLVIPNNFADTAILDHLHTGTALSATGKIVESLGKNQTFEIEVSDLSLIGTCDPNVYPLQPKRHSLSFLREQAHLRMRTQTIGSVMRLRSALSFAVHDFFHKRHFVHLHTPIITGSDAEGAGDMFKVTSLDLEDLPQNPDQTVDYKADFFGKPTNLTVSGQLEAEAGALAFGKVYTFGPTFRAENSNTPRHLAEFWMIEPEVAFADLQANITLAEDLLKYCLNYICENYQDELIFLEAYHIKEERSKPQAERNPLNLRARLKHVLESSWIQITYTEAVAIIKRSKPYKKKRFDYLIDWGADLQTEHERYLVEKHFKAPVIITDYPKAIKAFYMKANEDGKTVRAVDILFEGIGEIVGGSQREDDLEKLKQRLKEAAIPEADLGWYLELRQFGGVPHSGFGLGFERLVLFATGMGNIRDIMPFPRYPKHAEF